MSVAALCSLAWVLFVDLEVWLLVLLVVVGSGVSLF